MKNKGFTLIELLAVIILLALITGMISYTANRVIDSSKKSLYCTQVSNALKTAKTWSTDNHSELPENAEAPAITLCLGTYSDADLTKLNDDAKNKIMLCKNADKTDDVYNILEKKYLDDKDITNPETKKNLEGTIEITYNENTNQYNYKYDYEADGHDDNYCNNVVE